MTATAGWRFAIVLGALLPCVPAPAAAQSGATARAQAAREATSPSEREFEREMARYQAERARMMAEVQVLSHRMEAGAKLDARERHRLESELEAVVRRLTELNARVGMDVGRRLVRRDQGDATDAVARVLDRTHARFESATKTGYLGITLSPTSNRVRVLDDGGLYVRYFAHPAILSVDPSSPADRAGLAPGDTVLAYDGMDVRRELAMHEVLRPGRRVRMTVRRDGRRRDVPLTVASTPAIVRGRREEFFVPGGAVVVVPPQPVERARTSAPRAPGAVARSGRVSLTAPAVAPTPPTPPSAYRFELARGIAGAELARITPGLGAALGVRRGLLVTAVAPRSPAASAGLRDGDVIVSANGRSVDDLPSLSRAMSMDGKSRAVTLEIRRERKKRTVRLAW